MPKTRQARVKKGARAAGPAQVDTALQLVEALPVPVFFKSRDGKYLGVNKAWEEFFGLSRASFLGKQVKDLYPQSPAIAEKHLEMDGQLWRNPGGQSYEATVTARDGRARDTIYYKATFANGSGEVAGLIGAIVDITARKQAEASLLESERRFRRTFELAGSGVAHIALDRKFIRVNRRLCEILGYAEHELIGMTGREISHPEDLDVINKERKKLYDGEIEHVRVEKRYVRKDRSSVWVAFSMVVERDDAGKPIYEIAIFDEITERKRAEAAVLESEERFRSLTQLSSDWYWEQDADFGLKFMSRRMGERTGLDAAAYIGRKRWDQPALNLTDEDWAAHRAQLERHEPFRDFEMERQNPAGGTRWISVSGEPILDARGRFTGYRGVGSDVTARKQAEPELKRAP